MALLLDTCAAIWIAEDALSRAAQADNRGYLTLVDGEIHLFKNRAGVEPFGHVFELDQGAVQGSLAT